MLKLIFELIKVKTLVCGVKTITWGCTSCKTDATPTVAGQPIQVKSPSKIEFKNMIFCSKLGLKSWR